MKHRYRPLPALLLALLAAGAGGARGGNVVCDPSITHFTSGEPVRTVDVVYQGGGSAPLYGYSVLFAWDGAVVSAGCADVSEGDLLSSMGTTWFETHPAGTDSIIVDGVLLGDQPGASGPGVLFSVSFTGIACNMTVLDLTVIAARDRENMPVTGVTADDGLLMVDLVDPVFTITGPFPDGRCWAEAPSLGLSVSDACGDLDDAFFRVDGGPWSGDAGLFANHSGNAWSNPAWTLAGFDTLDEGPHTVSFRCTDDLGNGSNEPVWSFIKDTTPPPPATDFLALPGNGKVHLSWTNPADDFDHVKVLRKPWSVAPGLGYPEYARPAAGYPADPADGDVIYEGAGSGFVDSTAERSIWFYRVFTYDCAGLVAGGVPPAGSVPAPFPQGDRSTDYWLGDVTGYEDGVDDGLVDFWDFNALSRCYRRYSAVSPPPPPHNELDVGITDDGTRFGIPVPNDQIDVEEEMMLRANFNRVGPAGKTVGRSLRPAAVAGGQAPRRDGRDGGEGKTLLSRRSASCPEILVDPPCSGVDPGDLFDVRLLFDAPADSLTNFQAILRWDPAILEIEDVFMGSLYANLDTVIIRHMPFAEEESSGVWEVFDVLFSPNVILPSSGEIAVLRFRALAEGVTPVEFLSAHAMGADRYPLDPLIATAGMVCVGSTAVGVETPETGIVRWRLGAPSPNPFTGTTRIRLDAPDRAAGSGSTLAVYDARGRLVRRLVDGFPGGSVEAAWDGRDGRGAAAPSGIYFFKLQTPEKTITRKAILLR